MADSDGRSGTFTGSRYNNAALQSDLNATNHHYIVQSV